MARHRLAFVSGNRSWGGSEELWSATAAALAEQGHDVSVYKSHVPDAEPRIRHLRELRVPVRDLARFPLMPRGLFRVMGRINNRSTFLHEMSRLTTGLATSPKPELVLISQGGNYDGWVFAEVCRRMRLPYALLSQKASDLYWPSDLMRDRVAAVFDHAVATYFVAEHNLRLTEEQIGHALPRAAVVRNPFLVPWERNNDWPDERDGVRLACVGRLYPMEKGQDLLLRVLARERWRARPVSLTFYGEGAQSEGLRRMASYLGLTNVTFAGFTRDVEAVWRTHHALVLPSRCEGLPLVIVEAMLCGRVAIATNVGGSAEVLRDGVTGFVVPAATGDALDETMERAWNERERWRQIGEAAATSIRELVPRDPAREFGERLLSLVSR